MGWPIRAICLGVVLSVSGCAERARPLDPTPTPVVQPARQGWASYYGRAFDGRVTASGVRFDKDAMVAAHPTLPFGTIVRVTNLRNGRSVDVRIIDRGPAPGARANGVIIDLSQGAAETLGFIREGRTRVRIDVERKATDRD